MIEVITIANRDDDCQDCKLTIQYKIMENPPWWRRIMFGKEPTEKVFIGVWYGHGNRWLPGVSGHQFSMNPGRAHYFSRIWKYHVEEKKRSNITGPYKSIIRPGTGDRYGFKTKGEDESSGGGVKVIDLNSYRASRDSRKN